MKAIFLIGLVAVSLSASWAYPGYVEDLTSVSEEGHDISGVRTKRFFPVFVWAGGPTVRVRTTSNRQNQDTTSDVDNGDKDVDVDVEVNTNNDSNQGKTVVKVNGGNQDSNTVVYKSVWSGCCANGYVVKKWWG